MKSVGRIRLRVQFPDRKPTGIARIVNGPSTPQFSTGVDGREKSWRRQHLCSSRVFSMPLLGCPGSRPQASIKGAVLIEISKHHDGTYGRPCLEPLEPATQVLEGDSIADQRVELQSTV